MQMNKNVFTFIACESDYENSDIVLFGAPFDGTSSFRAGSRFASNAMRSDSVEIETYSPYQGKDLTDVKVFDAGDLELPFGNAKVALSEIEKFVKRVIKDKKIPAMIGGEHLVTLAAVKAVQQKYKDLNIIHFDAHADLRNSYFGEELSHATVIRRVWDIVGDGKIFQFGIRSGDKSEFDWGKGHVFTKKFNFNGLDLVAKELKDTPVYLSIDLDVLDPSIFPGTGTPEAGGVTFIQLLEAVLSLSGLNIVGFDITELAPPIDSSGVSTLVACKLLRELLIMVG